MDVNVADSLGAMDTENVETCIKNLRSHWKGELEYYTII